MKIIKALLGAAVFSALILRAGATTFYVSAANVSPVSPFTNWLTAAADIQSAIDAATNGDLILVTNGIYNTGGQVVYGLLTNRVVINKAVTVQSINGPAVTVIQGYQIPSGSTSYTNNIRGVYLTNNAALVGFSVIGGATRSGANRNETYGGGVYCESTNAFLTNCVLSGNSCFSSGPIAPLGGGIFSGTLNNCTLTNNTVTPYAASGGGANQSILNNCLIISNTASFGGGAAGSTLNYCSVIGNSTPNYGSVGYGGGLNGCSAIGCLIAGNYCNSVGAGGGADGGSLAQCIVSNNASAAGGGCQDAILNNCLIVANSASTGGGVDNSSSSTPCINCTIVGNLATNKGGGVYGGTFANCIIYGNNCLSSPAFSNIYTGNLYYSWTIDPSFVNAAGGDYHLQSNSPCINSGDNGYVSSTNDLEGNPRNAGGTVDIGADEYQTPTSILSYAWAQQYGLPIDGSADYLDLDGTGMENWQKSIAGLNPFDPASVFAMLPPVVNSAGGYVNVIWQSVSTRKYFIQRSTNLFTGGGFITIQSNVFGQTSKVVQPDSTATWSGPFFYRVGVQ